MRNFKSFPCGCGGIVEMLPAQGEIHRYVRNESIVDWTIPLGTLIPRCILCKNTYFNPVDECRIGILYGEFLKEQERQNLKEAFEEVCAKERSAWGF